MVQVKIEKTFQTPELFNQLNTYGIQVSDSAELLLQKPERNWILKDAEGRRLEIDFDENKSDYLRKHKGSGELIARGLGIKDNITKVVDLTAGLGIDAVLLSQIGFEVTSLERNPIMVFLLHRAQEQSTRPEIKRINWILTDALTYLKNYSAAESTSCYFDPMYPDKKKSALPRQEMVLFRNLVGADDDSSEVLDRAISSGFKRVVVKRPLKAPAILEKTDYQLSSKLIRYDVYYGKGKK